MVLCEMCGELQCQECYTYLNHSCNTLENNKEISFNTAEEVYEVFLQYRRVPFAFLVKIHTDIGIIEVVKDVDKDNQAVILFLWNVVDDVGLFKHVTSKTYMKRYNICRLYQGVKTYLGSNKHTLEHMGRFIRKMKTYQGK